MVAAVAGGDGRGLNAGVDPRLRARLEVEEHRRRGKVGGGGCLGR